MLLAMVVMVSSSLYDALADRELERMIERNKILHDKLIREKCPEPEKLLKKRELLTPSEDKLKLEVEEELHKKLLAMVIKCRKDKLQTTTVTTASETATSTTTTPASTDFSSTVASSASVQPIECQQAINLTESWRSDNKGNKLNNGNNCDSDNMKNNGRPWFRFTGPAGKLYLFQGLFFLFHHPGWGFWVI